MPRQPRDDQAGQIYHALNRGNQRQTLFHKADDFIAFELNSCYSPSSVDLRV
ncbi:MAG: hypothetical protein AB8B91_23625 [Rubripirellula sp.]